MEMYQVIRYFLNEMEKKIWHALLTLVLFCLYISITFCYFLKKKQPSQKEAATFNLSTIQRCHIFICLTASN